MKVSLLQSGLAKIWLSEGKFWKFYRENGDKIHKDSCFHHLQTLFVEKSSVRQLYLVFLSFDSHFLSFWVYWAFCIIFYTGFWLFVFRLLLISCYLDSVCQLLGSDGGHVLAVDPIKWVKLCPRVESLPIETSRLLFLSSANLVCGKQRCPTTWYTFLNPFD